MGISNPWHVALAVCFLAGLIEWALRSTFCSWYYRLGPASGTMQIDGVGEDTMAALSTSENGGWYIARQEGQTIFVRAVRSLPNIRLMPIDRILLEREPSTEQLRITVRPFLTPYAWFAIFGVRLAADAVKDPTTSGVAWTWCSAIAILMIAGTWWQTRTVLGELAKAVDGARKIGTGSAQTK